MRSRKAKESGDKSPHSKWLALLVILFAAGSASAGPLDEMSLERWTKLREVERFQLQAAERYWRAENWKAALDEYEKFVSLYERSEGASFAQLKWGLCQVRLRKANAAIKDGFQTVLDYWPESHDAALAGYFIGRTYKDMGQLAPAKKGYQETVKKYPQHLVASHALADLIEIAEVEKDFPARAELWKKLVFEVARTNANRPLCVEASKDLAKWCFGQLAVDDGVKALATSYTDGKLPIRVAAGVVAALQPLAADEQARGKADKLAASAVAYLRGQMPAGNSAEDKAALRAVLYAVADVHAAALQDDKVLAVYGETEKRCRPSDETLARLAAWYDSRSKFPEAAKVYRRFENKIEGLRKMAESCRNRHQWEPAIATYRELANLDEKQRPQWTAEMASMHHHARQFKEAVGVYQELMKLDPTNTPRWLWGIACVLRDEGKYREAIGHFRQCTNFPENYKHMAECHRRLKEPREALLLYNQILAGDANSAPWALLQIGYTWEEAGKKEEAIKAFQQVCKRYPKDSHASTAHSHLQETYKISVTLGGAAEQ